MFLTTACLLLANCLPIARPSFPGPNNRFPIDYQLIRNRLPRHLSRRSYCSKNGAEGGYRTPTGVTPEDFESSASAIPPPRQYTNLDILAELLINRNAFSC